MARILIVSSMETAQTVGGAAILALMGDKRYDMTVTDPEDIEMELGRGALYDAVLIGTSGVTKAVGEIRRSERWRDIPFIFLTGGQGPDALPQSFGEKTPNDHVTSWQELGEALEISPRENLLACLLRKTTRPKPDGEGPKDAPSP